MRTLEERYGSLASLNAAWGTSAATWEELRAPDEPNEACAEDLRAFTYQYSLDYFRKVHAAVRKHAPRQLDLGCRFAGYNQETLKACAEVADVVSFNIYQPRLEAEPWAFTADLGKPCLIGEFSFGASDRGSLDPGISPVEDQSARAHAFADYVNSVADLPAFVGCHWYQHADDYVTGRTLDGSNCNYGLASITDTPFHELLSAARIASEGIYERRYGSAGEVTTEARVRKKGVGHWTGEGEDFLDPVVVDELECGWFYNWRPARLPEEEKVAAEFVPMIWDETFVTDETLAAVKSGGCSALLGFNEPSKAGRANMSVEQALALWPRLMETGLRLGSPATGHGARWLDEFMEEAERRDYRVDFICLHWYGDITAPDAVEDLRRYLTRYWEKYHRPLWLTEFSGANWRSCTRLPVTFEDNARFAREAIAMLESLPFVERYAWWSTKVYPSDPHYPTTGLYWTADRITEVGAAYREADRGVRAAHPE